MKPQLQTMLSQLNYHILVNVGSAILTFVVGVLAAGIVKRLANRYINHGIDDTVKVFLLNCIHLLALILVVIISLAELGVDTTSLITILGVSSLAIGLALKDFLANVAAGFVVIFLRPFKIGDTIKVNGDTGKVLSINLFMTKIAMVGNEVVFIPNNKLITTHITNKTYHRTRQLDLRMGIGYDSDVGKAKQIIATTLAKNELVLDKPEPMVAVFELADSAVILVVRAWVKSEEVNKATFALNEAMKADLEAANITIPFPQMDVNLVKAD